MFFFSLNVAITGYVNSSFIESLGWSNTVMSSIYILSSIIALIILPKTESMIKSIGNKKFILTLLIGSALSLLGIITIKQTSIQLISFLLFLVLNFLIIFNIDILIEYFSQKKDIGKIRGSFFTIVNITWAIAPLVAGMVLDAYGQNTIIYFIAIVCVLISFFILRISPIAIKPKIKKNNSLRGMYTNLIKNNDLKNVFPISMMLHFIYAISLIYIPLHLHLVIGLSWIEIGSLIFISNIPFLVLGYPIGYIADNYIGEKEIMISGLIISALSMIGFIFINNDNFIAWVIIFLVSRVGLSLIETTTESYIFKKIKHNDIEMLSIERTAIPLGYILAPFIGFCVSLLTNSYIPIFIITGLLLSLSIYPALKLKDTK